jgi:hypothetical protein
MEMMDIMTMMTMMKVLRSIMTGPGPIKTVKLYMKTVSMMMMMVVVTRLT